MDLFLALGTIIREVLDTSYVFVIVATTVLVVLSTLFKILIPYVRLKKMRGYVVVLKYIQIISVIAGNAAIFSTLYSDIFSNFSGIGDIFSSNREVAVVVISLFLIVVSIGITIYFNPSRMTVIAGVSLGFIGAVVLVEIFFWINAFIDSRLEVGSVSLPMFDPNVFPIVTFLS